MRLDRNKVKEIVCKFGLFAIGLGGLAFWLIKAMN